MDEAYHWFLIAGFIAVLIWLLSRFWPKPPDKPRDPPKPGTFDEDDWA